MEIIVYAANPAATAELVARAIGEPAFAPPSRRHPGRWRGGPANAVSVLAATSDTPPSGIYIGIAEGRGDNLPEFEQSADGIRLLMIEGVPVRFAPHLPKIRLRADAGKEYYVEPLLRTRAARIRQAMASLGLSNARAVGQNFARENLGEGWTRDPGFRLLVDGPEGTPLAEIDAILAEGDMPRTDNWMRAQLSHGIDARAMAALDHDAWWLDEIAPD